MPDTVIPSMDQLLAALARTEELAPAPRTLSRVLQLLRQPDSGLQPISELICCDAGLAIDVLRCANSAFYSRSTHIAAITEAIQVIGFHETIRIVSVVAARQTTHRNLSSYGITADDFWSESLFNGFFVEALARHTGSTLSEEAYTAGLLRFVGRLAIDQALESLGFGLFWDRATPLPEWERRHVGLTQADVGAQLLRRWEFPEHMARAVEAQDESAGTLGEAHPLVPALNFAARIVPAGSGLNGLAELFATPVEPAADDPFAAAHHLTGERLGEILREAYRNFLEVRETLYSH